MSPYFVRYFRSNNPCPFCTVKAGTEKAPGRSMCGTHLAIAKMVWRLWATARRRLGRCIECAKKAQKTNCRCPAHRHANKMKGRAYYAANKERLSKRERDVKEAWIGLGRCPACPQHNPLPPGQRRCNDCRGLHKAYVGTDRIAVVDARQARTDFKAQRSAARAEEARAVLAGMGYRVTELPDGTPSLRRIRAE